MNNIKSNYEPQNISDLVIADLGVKTYLEDVVNGYPMENILLLGTNGTGKSTIAKLLPGLVEKGAYNYEWLAGEENFDVKKANKTLSNVIGLSNLSINKYFYVMFDELDKVQTKLASFWQMVDTWPSKIIVIATANEYMYIDKPMRSRFKVLNFPAVKAIDFLPRAMQILNAEKVSLTSQYVLGELKLVESFGDIRKYLTVVSDIHRNYINGRIPPNSPNANAHSRPSIKLPISRHLTSVKF